MDESVTAGSACVGGQPVAVIAGNFEFLAGSVGGAAAHRILAACERATALSLPLLGLPISGGTRMQEGAPAFILMAAIAGALRRHRAAGLPYLVYLRHPTAGGVFATWGSLGDVTFGQPGALVGFLGPKVYQGLYGRPFPPGVQTSEGLAAAGVIDGVATPARWREIAVELLGSRSARVEEVPHTWERAAQGSPTGHAAVPDSGRGREIDAWDRIVATREADRPGVGELLAATSPVTALSGTGEGEIARATVLAVTRVSGTGCVVVGQDRAAQLRGDLIGPADLRVVRRGIALARHWRLPLVTIIDTQGAELSESAELGGLAAEIARCLADLAAVPTPTMSLLLGGGAGGAAIALLPTDRVLALHDSWITPLPPEGAAVIRFGTVEKAPDAARAQRVTAQELLDAGAVDRIVVPGRSDWAGSVLEAVGQELVSLVRTQVDLGGRANRWSAVGQ